MGNFDAGRRERAYASLEDIAASGPECMEWYSCVERLARRLDQTSRIVNWMDSSEHDLFVAGKLARFVQLAAKPEGQRMEREGQKYKLGSDEQKHVVSFHVSKFVGKNGFQQTGVCSIREEGGQQYGRVSHADEKRSRRFDVRRREQELDAVTGPFRQGWERSSSPPQFVCQQDSRSEPCAAVKREGENAHGQEHRCLGRHLHGRLSGARREGTKQTCETGERQRRRCETADEPHVVLAPC